MIEKSLQNGKKSFEPMNQTACEKRGPDRKRKGENGDGQTERKRWRKSAKIFFFFFNGFSIDFIIDHYSPGIRWLILSLKSRTFDKITITFYAN